jgi:flagellar biosynthesis chaperone FliJ
MDQLRSLARLRENRLSKAQRVLYQSIQVQNQREEQLRDAQKELEDYQQKLPSLIEALFKPIMGQKVDKTKISLVLEEEQQLNAKVGEFEKAVQEAQKGLDAAKQQVIEDRAYALIVERKKMAIDELIKEEDKRDKLVGERLLTKVLDEFAGNRFVTRKKP